MWHKNNKDQVTTFCLLLNHILSGIFNKDMLNYKYYIDNFNIKITSNFQ